MFSIKTSQIFKHLLIVLLTLVFVSACNSQRAVKNRVINADTLIMLSDLQSVRLKTPDFSLYAAYRFTKSSDLLNVYIEGDGRSWVSRNQLSSDPTPINPVALRLAIIQSEQSKDDNIAWLARPCQYQANRVDFSCEPKYWSSHRFAQKVVDATNIAIDELMQKSGTSKVRLIGFSGGAAVAALVAAKRNDIDSLVTIAGNLDHQQVNDYHRVSSLIGSLNPKEVAMQLASIPQVHFVGVNDEVIPGVVADDFIKVQENNCAKKVLVLTAGHIDGWVDYWPSAVNRLEDSLSCSMYEFSISF